MSIEYLHDWNERLEQCGCCAMPTCRTPILTCESKTVLIDNACGHFFTNRFGSASMEPYMPNNPSFMTCEQKCIQYRQAVARVINDLFADDGEGHTYELNIDHSVTATRSFSGSYDDSESPRICEWMEVWSGTGSSTEEFPYKADNVLIKQEIEYTLNSDGTASGTVTDTYPDSANDETYPSGIASFSEVFYPADSWDNGTLTATSSGSDPYDDGAGLEGSTDWTLEVTYSDPITQDDMEAEATLALEAFNWDGFACFSSRQIPYGYCTPQDSDPSDSFIPELEEIEDCVRGIVETLHRYKWCLPEWHYGSYYRIEWDEVFFPDGWSAPDEGSPRPVVTPKSWVWTGPSTHPDESVSELAPEGSPSDGRCSPWSTVVKVPEGEEGFIEICNVRVLCYRSAYGEKFQLDESFNIYVQSDESSG